MKRKQREKHSKVFGTKQVLTQLNKAAHDQSHQSPSTGTPGTETFVGTGKWGWGESSGVIGST